MKVKEKIITGILMSLVMAFALSGFFILTKMGFAQGWQLAWFKGFISAWPVALVLSMLIGRPVGYFAHYISTKVF
ncbi:MAG: DUF2798 domain-containing protein [Pseudoruegeria sp.]